MIEVKDIMRTDITPVGPRATLKTAADLMADAGCEVLPVLNSTGAVLGAVRSRDVLARVLEKHVDPGKAPIKETVHRGVLACYDDQPLHEAEKLMRDKRQPRIFVVGRDHKFRGLLRWVDLPRDGGGPQVTAMPVPVHPDKPKKRAGATAPFPQKTTRKLHAVAAL